MTGASRNEPRRGRLEVPKTRSMFVRGTFVRSESGRVRAARDERGRLVANYPRASREDLRDAVGAARDAFAGWAGRSAFQRGQILFRVAELLEDRAGRIAAALARIGGRRAVEARAEVAAAVDRVFWYAGWADKFAPVLGGVNPVAAPFLNVTRPEPTGVVVVFGPARSPVLGLLSALVPVIVPGNTAVAVVDGEAAVLALDLGEVFAVSDLPPGVVNLLTGPRGELLATAAGHPEVNAAAWYGEAGAETRTLETVAAGNRTRVAVFDDPEPAAWRDPARQSPYRIEPFVAWKTEWHPGAE